MPKKANPHVERPLPLPSLSQCYPERPFDDHRRRRALEHYLTDSEREIIEQCIPSLAEDTDVVEPIRALMMTKMSAAQCRELSWKEIMAQLRAILSVPIPAGKLSLSDIRVQYGLDTRDADKIKKRLSRWRRRNDHEDQCRREKDTGTGREQWSYPTAIVAEIMKDMPAATSLKASPVFLPAKNPA